MAAICSVLSLLPALAHAQNPAAAEVLFEQARVAMSAGDYDIACARFRDSDRLDPAVGTRFNLADCEERRGKLATAWSLFRGVVAELAAGDDRRPIAEERVLRLKPRVPNVMLVVSADTPPGIRVRIDGVELGEATFGVPLPMDPGEHQLTLIPADGAPEQSSPFTIAEGESRELPIRAVAPSAAASASAEDRAAPGAPASPAAQRRRWGYIVGGAGVGAVTLGVITGILTLNEKSTANENCNTLKGTCNQQGVDANDAGETLGAVSTLGFTLGLVGIGAGAYLLLTSPTVVPKAARRSVPAADGLLRADFRVGSGHGFASVSGRF